MNVFVWNKKMKHMYKWKEFVKKVFNSEIKYKKWEIIRSWIEVQTSELGILSLCLTVDDIVGCSFVYIVLYNLLHSSEWIILLQNALDLNLILLRIKINDVNLSWEKTFLIKSS